MNGDGYQDLQFAGADGPVTLRAHLDGGAVRLDTPDGCFTVASEGEQGGMLRVDGVSCPVRVVRHGAELTVLLAGQGYTLDQVDPLAAPGGDMAGSDRVAAPIPARVTRVLVSPGDTVAKGAALLVLEAMKTEITLSAPADGVVESVRAAVGEMVEEGVPLVTFVAL